MRHRVHEPSKDKGESEACEPIHCGARTESAFTFCNLERGPECSSLLRCFPGNMTEASSPIRNVPGNWNSTRVAKVAENGPTSRSTRATCSRGLPMPAGKSDAARYSSDITQPIANVSTVRSHDMPEKQISGPVRMMN